MEIETFQYENNLFENGVEKAVNQPPGSPESIKGEEKIKDQIYKLIIPADSKFELKVEANVLKLAYTQNKLLSLSNSRTRILAHQVESTHRVINSLNHRFLMADEVGLGKTIEAGLVIKELVFRYGYKRILIVCPASLCMQWQNELQSKFNESFTVMDRSRFNKIRKGMNDKIRSPWADCDKIICSLDFIKSPLRKDELKITDWDIVVIDEAHRLRRDDSKSTLAYNVAEILSKNTKTFLLLTATPFRGKLEELYYLICLVDRNLLGPFQTFYNTYCLADSDLSKLKQRLSSVIIRRTKKEIGGFTKRHARTIRFELLPEERVLYDATTRYVIEEYNKAMRTENRAIGFVMTVFQKLLDSSTFALLSALKKRRTHLSHLLEKENEEIIRTKVIEKNLMFDYYDIDDLEATDKLLNKTIKKTRQELKEELIILENLVNIAESITQNKKAEKLREILLKLRQGRSKKFLIFTQFRTTQMCLKDILYDFDVELFHGSLDRDQKEIAIQNFKERAEVLICTEAGGEGRNLQFCNILINYDLPWSPLKIEQRIGRIHRFGQPKDVYIYNFSTKDTVAERILNVLTKKLKLFEESIGTPDVMLGQIEEELNINSLFMKMAANGKNNRKIYSEIDTRLEAAKESYEKLNELAITKNMDFNYDEYYRITLQERQYSNNRIEKFINRLRDCYEPVNHLIGNKNKVGYKYPIRSLPDGSKPSKTHGTFDSVYALNNENLEFLAFGNPIIDTLINKCYGEEFGGQTGVKIITHDRKISGMIFYYIVTFDSIATEKELMPVFIASKKSIKEHDIEKIEQLSVDQLSATNLKFNDFAMDIPRVSRNADNLFNDARVRILHKVETKINEIREDLDDSIENEVEKINDAYRKKIKEYEEQLERQVCQMKWFKKDMKSAITRTKNKISKEKSEQEQSLNRFNDYRHIEYSIELLSAGILITTGSQ